MIGPGALFVFWATVEVVVAHDRAAVVSAGGRFEVESCVALNEAARRDREVGYSVRADLTFAPTWNSKDEYLLQFQLHSPKLHLKGKHVNAEYLPRESVFDSYKDSPFYAHWKHGIIEAAYLDPEEQTDILNYKKSLISIFQYQSVDGEFNETDVSGECEVYYETISDNVFRKIKRRCDSDGTGDMTARRLARYTVGEEGLRELHAEELLQLGEGELGVKARSWHALKAKGLPPTASSPHASLEAALAVLPPNLRPVPLSVNLPDTDEFDQPVYKTVREAVAQNEAALGGEEAGGGGEAGATLDALRLLPAIRTASTTALRELLLSEDHHHLLAGLCRMLGLAGTPSALAAADEVLHLRAADPLLPFASTYLQAFALSDQPQESAILELLRLGEEAKSRAVSEGAMLSAAAAARRHGGVALATTVRDTLAKGLARCKEEECRCVRLQALGNLRRADTADLLAEHAGRAVEGGRAALAALDALARLPSAALTQLHLHRLTHVALDENVPFEVRAAVMDLVVMRRARAPMPLARVVSALHERGPAELRRLLWQRLRDLAAKHEAVRLFIAMLEPRLRTWDAQAHAGTSSVLVRETGWRWAGWRATLESVQVAKSGLLRRGTVRLLAASTDDTRHEHAEVLAVEVWTRGLEAIAGSSSDGAETTATEGEAEGAAGGLALSVAGARMPGIMLFDGQAELLGHVWAGAGSAPTAVLRALAPRGEVRARRALLTGAVLAARARSALALAIDAHAQISLWWRTARSGLELRAAAAGEAELVLATAWGRLRATSTAAASPRLRIGADLDFYDKLALCVRTRTDPYTLSRNVTLASVQGARRLAVRRERHSTLAAEGRTLALGAENDRTCRTLRAAEDDEESQQ